MRTGYGDSEDLFDSGDEIPFQGCGQGNGAGPTMWVTISSVLIGMMTSAGFGLSVILPLSAALVTATCFSFVDDTDLVEAADSVETDGKELFGSVQSALDLYQWSAPQRRDCVDYELYPRQVHRPSSHQLLSSQAP